MRNRECQMTHGILGRDKLQTTIGDKYIFQHIRLKHN